MSRYAIYLCGGPEDPATFTRKVEGVDCPREAEHQPMPRGYSAFFDECNRLEKTHRQVTCEGCGRFSVWVPR